MLCDYVTHPVRTHDGLPFGGGHVRCGLRAQVLAIVTEVLPSGTVSDLFVHACGAHADDMRLTAARTGRVYKEEHLDGQD
jgi:hypothetical protein